MLNCHLKGKSYSMSSAITAGKAFVRDGSDLRGCDGDWWFTPVSDLMGTGGSLWCLI